MEDEKRQIRILIGIAAILCALIIGYNLFFVPGVEIVTVTVPESESSLENSEDISSPYWNGRLNINTASVEELDEFLPGIGPVTAQKIVDYRTAYGSFSSIEEIMNVSGIGEKTFADIQNLITV